MAGGLFGGYQINHEVAALAGLIAALRYDFATGKRWMPFVEISGGPTLTDIGDPDLSTKFEFNLHSGAGMHWFWNEHFATTLECQFLHLSNAGMRTPNQGVNNMVFFIGVNWFF